MKGLHLNCSHITGLLLFKHNIYKFKYWWKTFWKFSPFQTKCLQYARYKQTAGDIVSAQFKGKETGQTDEHRTGHWSWGGCCDAPCRKHHVAVALLFLVHKNSSLLDYWLPQLPFGPSTIADFNAGGWIHFPSPYSLAEHYTCELWVCSSRC